MGKKVNKVLTGCFLALCFTLVSSFVLAATVPGKVTGTKVNMRKSPNTSSEIITKLNYSQVSIIDSSYGWYKVTYNNKTGWVNDDYVKLTATAGIINANGVNFRSGASTSSKKIGTLNKNARIQILSVTDGWNKIKVGSKVGYVASRFVTKASVTKSSVTAKTSRSTEVSLMQATNTEEASVNGEIAVYAKQFVGVKYVYGGDSPAEGFDCSGFIGYVYKKFNVRLNRSAESMYSNGVKVSKTQLHAGDILFFDASSRKASGSIDHVGIYLGSDLFIHASSSNGEVKIQKLSEYRGTYLGAKRVIKN